MPSFRMSQGIVCASPSLTITPYVTDAHTFSLPRETVTRQNIYDETTGDIKYVQETPRFEKENFNFNYGISMQLNIPLGKSHDLPTCQFFHFLLSQPQGYFFQQRQSLSAVGDLLPH